MCEIDWTSISIVLATLFGPIFAVWASEIRQRRSQQRDRREWVFRTLMTTRSTPLRGDHVSALNHIDFAFPKKSYPEIADAWGLYYAHLRTPQVGAPGSQEIWEKSANNLLANLIHLMAKDLNIPFSKTQINEPSYSPDAHGFTESQQNELRTLLLEVLKEGRPINIRSVHDHKP